ncbi:MULTISPECIES: TonB-dependent receptor domain-containing protein [Sphingobium]|uniref:TonB-dependent receptor n=1 Tax=Sphingobium fuliginis (strain ATCC 27551) TaxID=336203 RepID=A0ABQ1FB24_SPHSA|nr:MULTISPECIES: TonB-dependent receptor [Sphingobium]AJR24297.1 TonB-dependent receptor [Sphingobium sp. YBL2]RYL99783.1 TonB-dependent receptor [Sphingobium fuliginis]WDA36384.1 TonB-dependent receptor [Sphingobium sp. YC-XJ3]GGA04042.1 TonB-dependent receptor [Sphingobium fuliginis]
MYRSALLRAGCAFSALSAALPVFAQDAPADAAPQAYHDQRADIVVTAIIPRRQGDILSGTSVVSGEELTRALRPTIGDTLAHQPGVSATSFGPNASRPVLRGFQGERVRILTDGIGSFDVSNTSVDHAVAINPLTADRIEVLRGPAALLYGSSAIGGVVNVIDSRIPRRVPDEPIHVDGIATYGSAANERTGSGEIEAPIGDKFVVHFDGSYSKSGDLDTGSYILTPALRAQANASSDPEIRDLATLRDKLPNSAARTWEVAGGAALITDGGNLGFSVAHTDNFYGVPVRYSLDPDGEAEKVRLHMKQDRADLRAELPVNGGFLESIRLRAGFADYQHQEIEETGEVGTTFYNQSIESRLELVQARRGGWDGAIGAQFFARNFHVVGEEKFLPRNETEQLGFFTLQSFDLGTTRVELGGRYEHTRVGADADETLLNPAYHRSFNALSGSLGISQELAPGWRVGLNLSRTERAPSAEELFARGNHAGTQAFELGNPDFGLEKSWGIEGTLRGQGNGYTLSLSAYHNWFDGYIYDTLADDSVCMAANGGEPLDFPCYQNLQANARYLGFEAEGTVKLGQIGGYALNLDGVADYVRATIVGSGPAPRIPPLRLLGGVELQGDRLSLRGEVERSFAQNRIADTETPTDGFTLVNASLSFKPLKGNDRTTITLSANNIFDVEARRAASFLKDYAPLAGRDIRLTARLSI